MRLTPVSYIVLGLLDQAGEATPYELHQMAGSLSDLWSVPRAQLYREPERLAEAGLLTEKREQAGRRRRRFRLTRDGRRALRDWLDNPTAEFTELREPGLLRLFFGADPKPLARIQLEIHERKLREYQETAKLWPGGAPAGPRRALEAGMGHEREWVRFWKRLA
ncbi:MAG TPA: helix-turn-helix transcriptional regulator [Thermoleophilaceae bacterium]